jgi:hypothetical protein
MPAFEETYAELRRVMLQAAPRMRVVRDDGRELILHARWVHPLKPREPTWFGAVRSGKAYISYHLMPLYTDAALTAEIGPGLVPRMQGKSCFNFTRPDRELFRELLTLTRRCARAYALPPSGPVSSRESPRRRTAKKQP